MNSPEVDRKQLSCQVRNGRFLSFGFHEPHEHVVLFLRIMTTSTWRKVGQRTGFSSQSSPNSSNFAKRSLIIGSMNSISCWTFDGRLDSTRETTLVVA